MYRLCRPSKLHRKLLNRCIDAPANEALQRYVGPAVNLQVNEKGAFPHSRSPLKIPCKSFAFQKLLHTGELRIPQQYHSNARSKCLEFPSPRRSSIRSLYCTPVCMAKPSKKGPSTTVKIFCAGCKQYLYKYRKGGTGNLVKCFKERIVEDETGGKLECPNCGQQFAREAMIRGRPANKIVGGKIFFQK